MYLTRRAEAEERRHRFIEDRKQSAAEEGAVHGFSFYFFS